ncbi:T9SS type A sorting domain-containing protein [Hymenobacter sp. BT664]|uniref:T9SS type A sorting domain-containing protein n=1 Tax=Hymenobacter montanus TaxID=2771359 RepID=A0A927BBQ9_9BACT|nr:T9SS type A sorting domain-containing protein [Hymenobacter montanus]MBD2767521.1 T9SS type A sorting domain-containing protein [Hymenobacter montanus]
MKNILLFSLLSVAIQPVVGQTFVAVPGRVPVVVCPARPENMHTRVAPPAAYLEQQRTGRRATAATIQVTYTGFTPQAQAAFQRAVDIWQSILSSPVTIHVNANWTPLAAGVLGSAGTTGYYTRLDGASRRDVRYPVALAEKIAGRDLNAPTDADINANFSSTFNWYYGLDANPPSGQYDLVTVVLHELGHGLGFQAGTSYDATANQGTYGTPPVNFATYIENLAGQQLTNATLFANPSAALGAQFRSNNLYFNSPLAKAVNSGVRPKLYAPTTFSGGSSISHLDESTYLAGNVNSLMTPQIGSAEAIHDPGPITRAIFNELGWFNTAIRHTPLRDTEVAQNFVINTLVESDGTVKPNSVKLVYAINGGAETTVVMTATATPNQYTGTIPNPGLNSNVSYYLQAEDVETNRTYTAPGLYATSSTPSRYRFRVGPDTQAPAVTHRAPSFLFASQLPYQLTVYAKDNQNVGTVTLEYNVNGTARPNILLNRQNDTTFVGQLTTAAGPINTGDVVSYRVVVRDVAVAVNQTVTPASGLYSVQIVSFKAPVTTYVNALNSSTPLDFVGDGFSITQPAGFTTPAIHSDHPYADGADANFQSNIIYQMLVPIIVKANPTEAVVKFDEIVLVEPGDPGSVFGGANFYDYVVVEGSKDNGVTWTPLAPGYDCNAQADWRAAWDSGTSGLNSTGVGTPALFKPRTLNLRDQFAAGDVVRLRFRLFSDQLSHGWGWAIDNLAIQDVVVSGTALAELKANDGLQAYPNPTTGYFRVQAQFERPVAGLQLVVRNSVGQEVLRQAVAGNQRTVSVPVDLSGLASGMYHISLGTADELVSRKVLVQK